jgi:hypothetical protein
VKVSCPANQQVGLSAVSDTRWTFTDADGRYTLRSLPDGPRTLTASTPGVTFANGQITLAIAGKPIDGQDFRVSTGPR